VQYALFVLMVELKVGTQFSVPAEAATLVMILKGKSDHFRWRLTG
jgi:hypothetical protein